jgi:formate dehydrogenase gamma subunit
MQGSGGSKRNSSANRQREIEIGLYMTTSNPETPAVQPENFKAAHAQKQARALHLRRTLALADRVRVMADGSRRIVRFKSVEIVEHWLLLITFTILGLSGLLQMFARVSFVAWIINTVLGGIDNLNAIHEVTAIAFGALCLFHFVRILAIWFVKREPGAMLPQRSDGSDILSMVKFNLGKIKERPRFDRFTIEEKLGYWALVIIALIMLLTGVILWVPTIVTQFVPASVIQVARTIHGLTAILAVIGVLTWHLYFTVVKERNSSIFTGLMSEQHMKKDHPLEYERIMAARDEVQKMSKGS